MPIQVDTPIKVFAQEEYHALHRRVLRIVFDVQNDLRKIGGEKYAQLCALAYRLTFAGNKIVADANGQPLMFPKETFSNGCIGTVDVLFPQALKSLQALAGRQF